MPYIPKPRAYDKFRRLLLGYEMNGPKLGRILGCSHVTAKQKLDEPGRFTLGDIRKLNVNGHIPIEELRDAIQF